MPEQRINAAESSLLEIVVLLYYIEGDNGNALSSSLGLLLLTQFEWGFGNIGIIEEVGKEHEVTGIHQKRQLDVLIGDLAVKAIRLHLDHPEVDQASNDHLEELQSRNHHGD